MNYRRGFCLLGLIAIFCSSAFAETQIFSEARSAASKEPLRLKLMTYNIRIGVGGGNWDGNPAKINLSPVAKMISSNQVDFAGLQEVDRFRKRSGGMDQPKWLAQRLAMKVAFHPAYSVKMTGVPDEEYGLALLSPHWIHSFDRFALFKPDYSKSHPNYPDYYSEQRILLHALVSMDSRSIHVFVTHLGLTPDQREKQVQDIVEIMARYSGPKILMGDFNAEPTSPEMAPLFHEYRDALSEARVKHEDRKSFPAGTEPKSAIDYIFLSTDFHVVAAHVIRDAALASDHNPVFAEVLLP